MGQHILQSHQIRNPRHHSARTRPRQNRGIHHNGHYQRNAATLPDVKFQPSQTDEQNQLAPLPASRGWPRRNGSARLADFNHCLDFKMRWQTNVVKSFVSGNY
jgi:hypothetical protein